MKKNLFLLFLLLPICVTAQIRFGYVNYAEIVGQMPQYARAKQHLADLQVKYEEEAERNEAEFQRKFADFLQGQKDFPANILLKRQAELQDVMERGIAFRKEAQTLLDKAEADMMQEVYNQLNAAISAVGQEHGYAFVLNRDGNAAPFVNPLMGDDVSDLVRVKLGILKSEDVITKTPAPAVAEPTQGAEAPEQTPEVTTDDSVPATTVPDSQPVTSSNQL